jgi:hypothetical protein
VVIPTRDEYLQVHIVRLKINVAKPWKRFTQIGIQMAKI